MSKFSPINPILIREKNKQMIKDAENPALNHPTCTLEIPNRIQNQLNNGTVSTDEVVTYVKNTISKTFGTNGILLLAKVKEDSSAVTLSSIFVPMVINNISKNINADTFWNEFITEEADEDTVIEEQVEEVTPEKQIESQDAEQANVKEADEILAVEETVATEKQPEVENEIIIDVNGDNYGNALDGLTAK